MNLLRNRTKLAAKHLAPSICGVCVCERAKKGWLCVMWQWEKEQMLELPPLMTNIRSSRWERRSQNGHISCFFPTRPARRRGIFSGCGWWRADGVERFRSRPPGACCCQLSCYTQSQRVHLAVNSGLVSRNPQWIRGDHRGRPRVGVRCAGSLWASGRRWQIGGLVEGRGSDGWALRLAKFNAWSVTVTQGVSVAKRDGEPLQGCLVFMPSGWRRWGWGCWAFSSCVVDSRVISGVFATCLFSLAGLSLDGGCCWSGPKTTMYWLCARFNYDIKGMSCFRLGLHTWIQISRMFSCTSTTSLMALGFLLLGDSGGGTVKVWRQLSLQQAQLNHQDQQGVICDALEPQHNLLL